MGWVKDLTGDFRWALLRLLCAQSSRSSSR
jgi:hypothetical protein